MNNPIQQALNHTNTTEQDWYYITYQPKHQIIKLQGNYTPQLLTNIQNAHQTNTNTPIQIHTDKNGFIQTTTTPTNTPTIEIVLT